MDDFFIGIYVTQIKDQINEAEEAFKAISSSTNNAGQLFSSVHHFIIHVSNVIKIIQPNFKDDNDFRKYRSISIRRKYPNFPDIDPKSIHVRNDFEHYDERIDYWVINSKRHNYADHNLGPISAIQGLHAKDNFKWFDPSIMTLYFCGNEYKLNKLYDYMQEVKKAINEQNN